MRHIGITGGIGSGKSMICKVFRLFNIPTYDADIRAKWLMNNDPRLIAAVKRLFGEHIYEGGKLQNKDLAAIVFKDKNLLDQLNAQVHPSVGEDFRAWSQKQNSPYIIKEAALLFESGSYKELDQVITVYAPEALRIDRVLQRDPMRSPEQVQHIISRQMPEKDKLELADHIIYNDDAHMVIPQIAQLHITFLNT